jgi:hypothetical protein
MLPVILCQSRGSVTIERGSKTLAALQELTGWLAIGPSRLP